MIEEMKGNVMDLQGEGWKVLAGSCLDRLPELADESVDAVVCDPPYELGFMGKSWDSSGIAYDVNVWKECLRVLKPGGHVLAFGGSRTWHRLAVAVEDAGFELRDSIAWLYGSGFPKSLDVSKAIDKGTGENKQRQLKFVNWMRSTGITAKQINDATKTQMSSHYIGLSQPVIATADLFDKLRPYLPEIPEEIERLVAERTGIEWTAYKNREVIGQKEWSNSANHFIPGENHAKRVNLDITAAATAEAQKWQGWGTALKPAFEPVVVGRKPLKGTVAANVLAYGVGGLNIDATRIGTETMISTPGGIPNGANNFVGTTKERDRTIAPTVAQGRWPSNVILDEYTAELIDQQSGITKSGDIKPHKNNHSRNVDFNNGIDYVTSTHKGDSGGASRFFYIAKANKRDRNEGLDGLEEASASVMVDREEGSAGMNSPRAGAGRTSGAKNFHPTVKPTDLMRQLIRLVTPLGGVVLDPFTGSGSTGKAAILEGMQFIGCELTPDYLPIIEGRINWAVEQVKDDKLKAEQESAEVLF